MRKPQSYSVIRIWQAVHFNTSFGADEDILFPVDHPGLHQIAGLRIHLNYDVGRLYREFSPVDQIGRGKLGCRAEFGIVAFLKMGDSLLGHPAVFQQIAHQPLRDHRRFLVLILMGRFFHLGQLAELLVYCLRDLVAAILGDAFR